MPEVRADPVGLAGQTGQAAAQAYGDDGSRASGAYKGGEVKVIDQQSLVADALEELTSELSEETEKDVSEREVEDGRKSDSLERLLRLSEVNELLKSLGDLDKKDLFRGLNALIKQQGQSADQIRQQARQQFGEPAHQYALLKSYAEALQQRGAPATEIAAAQEALDGLMEEEGASVRAALNIAETAGEFADGALGDRQALRNAYRSNVHDYQDMPAVLDDLVERFGENELEQGVAFMTKALAADLAAGGPSIDRTKLALIVNDMHRLESLITMLGHCGILVENAWQKGARRSFTAVALLRELVPMLEAKWLRGDQIAQIPQRAGLEEIEAMINFLTDLMDVVRMIPQKSFVREENRLKLREVIQQVLDEAVAREEEDEEDEEEDRGDERDEREEA